MLYQYKSTHTDWLDEPQLVPDAQAKRLGGYALRGFTSAKVRILTGSMKCSWCLTRKRSGRVGGGMRTTVCGLKLLVYEALGY